MSCLQDSHIFQYHLCKNWHHRLFKCHIVIFHTVVHSTNWTTIVDEWQDLNMKVHLSWMMNRCGCMQDFLTLHCAFPFISHFGDLWWLAGLREDYGGVTKLSRARWVVWKSQCCGNWPPNLFLRLCWLNPLTLEFNIWDAPCSSVSEVHSCWLPDHLAVAAACKHKPWDGFPVASVAERHIDSAEYHEEHGCVPIFSHCPPQSEVPGLGHCPWQL